jgi:hypothetical protein
MNVKNEQKIDAKKEEGGAILINKMEVLTNNGHSTLRIKSQNLHPVER